MPDDLTLEIGGELDPSLQRAIDSLNKRVESLNKPLKTAEATLRQFEKATTTASKAQRAHVAAIEKVHKIANSTTATQAQLARATENAARTSERAAAAAKKQSDAIQRVAAADRAAAIASRAAAEAERKRTSMRGRAGAYLNSRGDNWGASGAGRYVSAGAAGAGAGLSLRQASSFGYQNQLIANTGDLSDSDRDMMAQTIKRLTDISQTNQLPAELQKALNVYTSAGLDVKTQGLPALQKTGQTATAYGIPIEDVSATVASAMANLGIKAEQIAPFLDGMAAAGKAGRFEMKNFAEHFGSLSANMAQYGVSGMEGAKYIASAMQAIQVSSKNSAEAATNWENVKNKIFATETADKFADTLDFDLPAFLEEVRKGDKGREAQYKGNVIDAFVKKTKELTGGDIMKVAPAAVDAQFRAGLMALMNNQKMTDTANTKWDSSGNVVQKDFERTTATTQEKLKQAQIEATLLAIELGKTLEPALAGFVKAAKEVLPPIAAWIAAHPELTSKLVLGAGAIMALNIALGPMVSLFRTAGGLIGMTTKALGGLATAAGPAGTAAGSTMVSKIGLALRGAAGSAAVVAGSAALGLAIGNALGEQISKSIIKASNEGLDNGTALINSKGKFRELGDNIANRRSANLEDRRAAYDLMINNPKLKEGIDAKLAEINKTRTDLQAQYDALMVQRRAATNPGQMVRIDEQMEPIRGALSQLPSDEARLKSAFPIMETAEKFKANDPATLRAALEATQKIEDDKTAKAAGLKSVFANSKESDNANQLRDIAITIYGVGEQDPNKLGEVVKQKIQEALGERDSDGQRQSRQAQADQTSAF